MKKPMHGDYLNVRYDGGLHRLRCDDVMETPARGAGAATFTIVSETQFERGREAQLIVGADELPIQIERVTVVGNRRRNIVLFHGVFESTQAEAR